MQEDCGVCGATVPFSVATHVIVHPPDGEVSDYYVCRDCYEEHFALVSEVQEEG